MKIAQIAPLAESVPPKLYGGTERVVAYLTEELVRLGHQVTLFASGDSATRARLVACAPRALRLDSSVRDPVPHLLVMLERVRQRAHEFDVLHFHIDPLLHFPLFRGLKEKTLTTLHGRLDLPDLQPLFREFSDMPVVSISDSQRAPARGMNAMSANHTANARYATVMPTRVRLPSAVTSGCRPPSTSTIDSLVWPSQWSPTVALPLSSGPRCPSRASIASQPVWSTSPYAATIPQIVLVPTR
jgi:glycosyltransferase involved in cell wall biosynthesis